MTLLNAPLEKPLKIVDICGGEGIRRKLLSLGFFKGDVIELDSQAILRGPLLVRNVRSDTRVALGRGIARGIHVEVLNENR
ncbi:MAG TPA: FeoA family protein [Candidatus Aminicenantes bacterium]|nr:FeoA family protein [Acidobacteriota bacterium]HOI45029.1 FeoA family protein [Candidatus Aminicenantes bacterium]